MLMPNDLEDEQACLEALRGMNRERAAEYDPWTGPGQAPIPEHILPGLARYLVRGIVPGSFMEAMLTNDLRGVMQCADDTNMAALPAIWSFFYNNLPGSAWGSVDNMKEWVQQREGVSP